MALLSCSMSFRSPFRNIFSFSFLGDSKQSRYELFTAEHQKVLSFFESKISNNQKVMCLQFSFAYTFSFIVPVFVCLFNLVPRRRHLSVSMLNKHYLLNITLVLPGLNPKAAEKYPHEYLGVPTTLIIIQTRFWRLEVFDKNSNAHFPLVINHNPLHSQGSQLYTSDPQRIDE